MCRGTMPAPCRRGRVPCPWRSPAVRRSAIQPAAQPRHITLSEARSRLYQRRFLQPNTNFAAFFEIYKIFILLHHSEFKNSAKFRQTFSQFCSFIFKISLIFRNFCPKCTNFDEFFPEFPANCTDKIKIC